MPDNTRYTKTLGMTKVEAFRDYVRQYLRANGCSFCGEDNILCLQFDHINPATKSFDIAAALSNPYHFTLIRLAYEIETKCRVLCANCHQQRTFRQRNNWRLG